MMLTATAGGIISTIVWAIFQSGLSAKVGSGKVAMSYGAAICIVAWVVALLSTVGYGMNAARSCCQPPASDNRDDEDDDYDTKC